MRKSMLLACCFTLLGFSNASAQKNELSFMAGGGKLSDQKQSINASALTIAYNRHLLAGLAIEGSLDLFFVKNGSLSHDDFGAAQIAVVYHFGALKKGRLLVPYLAAGIGSLSTDFTEIPPDVIYRFGGGVKYYFRKDSRFGLRVEVRDEITHPGHQDYPLPGEHINLFSVRAGIVYKF